MTSPPQCSIVIRCYNEEQHIGRLLSGIMKQTIGDVEIILVDSGSTDATLAIASRYPVRVLSIQPEEFSFGRSLNLGCRSARGEYIVIASGHVYPVYEDWLEQLLSPFSNPKTALVYGRQRGDETTNYAERQIFAKWYPMHSNPQQENPFCNNANAAIRREIWKRLRYNETLTGLEDLDWAKRAMELNHHITYKAEAVVVHIHNETLSGIFNRYRREALALKRILPEEHFTLLNLIRLLPTNILSDYYCAWHDGVLLDNLFDISLFRFMHFWGTYHGFSNRDPITSELKEKFYYPRKIAGLKAKNDLDELRRPINYTKSSEEK